jgi:hypothetical protein
MWEDDDDVIPEFYDSNETTVNSSLYSVDYSHEQKYFEKIFNKTALVVGIIIRVYEVDDEKNTNKNIPEYDVLVVQQNGLESMEPIIYKNCINVEAFGGKADFFEYKMRPVDNAVQNNQKAVLDINFKEQHGNMVLLLCLDGSTDKGVIIKSITHKGRKTKLTKEAGLHLEGEYNGLNWKIDKEGALTVTFKSKTNNEGIPQDKQAGGTHIQIDKTGQVDINTGLKDAEETYIRMDKKNKDVGLKAGNNIGLTAKKDVGINAEGNVNISSKASVAINAEGTANFTAKSAITVDGGSALTLKGGNVTLNGENGVTIEGQKTSINTSKIYLGQGGTPALLQTTQFIGVGNFGAPVVSQAIGPFSSTVFIAP